MAWADIRTGATGTPAGSDRQIQFNSAGAFAASGNLVFTSAGFLGIGTAAPQYPVHVISAGDSFYAKDTNSNGWGEIGLANDLGHEAWFGQGGSTASSEADTTFVWSNVSQIGIYTPSTFFITDTSTYTPRFSVKASAAGTALLPTFYLDNDTTTGMFHPAAQQLAITTNAVERLRVTNTGVGIGTAIPGEMLFVSGGNIATNKVYKIGATTVLALPDADTSSIAVGGSALAAQSATSEYNVAVGQLALGANTTGAANTAVGYQALAANTTAGSVAGFSGNTAVGYQALATNTTGNSNTAVGFEALATNTIGNCNTALGINALYKLTTGTCNTAIGDEVLWALTTGSDNIAIGGGQGANTMAENLTAGNSNIAIGAGVTNAALGYLSGSSSFNTVIGDSAAGLLLTSTGTTAVGAEALYNTTGSPNDAFGYNAGYYISTGASNVALGYEAMQGISGTPLTGSYNTAVGYQALLLAQGAAANNTAVGYKALTALTTGSTTEGATAFGAKALVSATGSPNDAFGFEAGEYITSGTFNLALGEQALQGVSATPLTGSDNIAIGPWALLDAQGAMHDNIAIGTSYSYNAALEVLASGSGNVAIGGGPGTNGALGSMTSGSNSTAIGTQALAGVTTGSPNDALGYDAGEYISTGASNVALGYQAMQGVSGTPLTGGYNTAVGNSALFSIQGAANNNVAVGYEAGQYISTSIDNVAVGYQAMMGVTGNMLTGSYNTAVGQGALTTIQGGGSGNTAVGQVALQFTTTGSVNTAVGVGALNMTNGNESTAVGNWTLWSATSGPNDALGSLAGANITSGLNNVAIGYHAMESVSGTPLTGNGNTAVGNSALFKIQGAAASNVAVGNNALYNNTTGNYNTAVGGSTLFNITTATNNTAIGYTALINATGGWNTALGSAALYLDTSGYNNTALGYQAGNTITTGTSNVYIGYNAEASAATDTNEIVIGEATTGNGSNTVTLGNSSNTNTYDYGTLTLKGTTSGYVAFAPGATPANQTYTLPSAYPGTSGYVLSSTTAGIMSWVANGSGARLDQITAATGANTINSAANAQEWDWNSLTTGNAMTLASNSVTTGSILFLSSNGTAAGAAEKGLNISLNGANGTAGVTTYGAYITNTHSTNTSTNVGLYASASGGATANYAALFPAGNVGIGTTAPAGILDVEGGTAAAATNATNIHIVAQNGGTGTTSGGSIYLMTGADGGAYGYGCANNAPGGVVISGGDATNASINIVPEGNCIGNDFATIQSYNSAGTAAKPLMLQIFGGDVGIGPINMATGPTSFLQTADTAAQTASYTSVLFSATDTSSTASVNKTGLSVQSTGTWNGTGAVNTGLVVNATGGTTNYAATFSGGNVGIGTASPAVSLAFGTTDAILLPSGTTAQQPAGVNGMIRYNSTTAKFEGYQAGSWQNMIGGAGGSRLDQITAATSANTINSGAFAQEWDWNSLTTGNAMTLASNSVTTGSILFLSSNGTAAGAAQKGLNISLNGANGTAGVTTYGAYITNTHSTNTSTNVGLYASASGGATANYAAIFAAGNVGIANAAPTFKLEVTPAATADGIVVDRLGAGSTNGSNWGFGVTNSANTTQSSFGETSSTYTTGGSAAWLGNSQTYIVYPSQLRIGTGVGAVPAMTFNSSGQVGIGTTNPGALLDLGQVGTAGVLKMEGSTSNAVTLSAGASPATMTYTWPTVAPTAGQVLASTVGGQLSWATASGSPGGANTQIQFNSAGSFGGDANLTYTAGTTTLAVPTVSASTKLSLGLAAGAGAPTGLALADLSGDSISAPTNGQCLTYNGANWINGACSSGASLNTITAATANNTPINSGAFTIGWNWNSLATGNALTLGSSSLTSGNILFVSSTSAGVQTGAVISAANATTGAGFGVKATMSGNAAAAMDAVYGSNTGALNTGAGVYGLNAGTGVNYGVEGVNSSTGTNSAAVYGVETGNGASGTTFGGYFTNSGTFAGSAAVYGVETGGTNATYGVVGTSSGGVAGDAGVVGAIASGGAIVNYGVSGTTNSTGAAYGVYGSEIGASNTGYGVYGLNASATGYALGAKGALQIIDSADANYVGLKASGTTANVTYTLPTAGPAVNGYALTSTTGGVMSWAAASGAPGGANTQIQFNSAGSFGGDAGLTYTVGTTTLSVPVVSASTKVTMGLTAGAGAPGGFGLADLNNISISSPASGQVLSYNGTNWVNSSSGGGGTPAGATKQIQFNSGGSFGANANFVFDTATGNVGIGTATPAGTLDVEGGTAAASTNGTNINIVAQSALSSGTNSGGNINLTAGAGESITYPTPDGKVVIGQPNSAASLQLYGFDAPGLDFGIIQVVDWTNTPTRSLALQPFGGSLGIGTGTTTPAASLDVEGSGGVILNAGPVGIGTTIPGELLFVSGGNIATNGVYKIGATTVLALPDADTSSIAVGGSALAAQSATSEDNVAIGYQAGEYITTSTANVAIGYEAMMGLSATPMTGGGNTAVGMEALYKNTTGVQNTAIGIEVLWANTTGSYNIAIGAGSGMNTLESNTTGNSNIAIGAGATEAALGYLSSGSFNTVIGDQALGLLVTGSDNTALGAEALYSATAGPNDALGFDAGYYITTGTKNVAIGYEAMQGISGTPLTGTGNTAVGNQAFYMAQGAAQDNTAVGIQALYSNTTGTANVAIGVQALYANTTGGDNMAVGDQALYVNVSGNENTAMGDGSLQSNVSGSENAAFGHDALSSTTGSDNTAIGSHALWGSTTGPNDALGYDAGYEITTGASNVALGYNAMGQTSTAITGSYNTALGNSALYSAQGAAADNVAIGYNAGEYITTGAGNVAVGFWAMMGTSGAPLTGSNNTAVGNAALQDATTTATGNVAIGYEAGNSITTGTENVFLGYEASAKTATDTNEIVIGEATTGNGSNTITLGNSSNTATYMYGTPHGDSTTGGATRNPNNFAILTADFTDASSTSLQVITGLTFTLSATLAQNIPFECNLMYTQATNVSDSFGIGTVTYSPTRIDAEGEMTLAGAGAVAVSWGALANDISGTTAQAIVTATPSVTTVNRVRLTGLIQEASNAGTSVLNFYVKQATAGDVIVVKAGSWCRLW